jgi:hypothetical protein
MRSNARRRPASTPGGNALAYFVNLLLVLVVGKAFSPPLLSWPQPCWSP